NHQLPIFPTYRIDHSPSPLYRHHNNHVLQPVSHLGRRRLGRRPPCHPPQVPRQRSPHHHHPHGEPRVRPRRARPRQAHPRAQRRRLHRPPQRRLVRGQQGGDRE